jgi:23S rRNA (uracil1939-C5)-methyltransferase
LEGRLILEVSALDAGGRGVARDPQGKVVFIEGALPGETVEAQRIRSRRSYDLMRTSAVLHASGARRTPRCAVFGVCGGCATQHADARTQVAAKQRWLEDCLERIGRLRPETLLAPIYGTEWGYRHRARFAVRRVARKGGVLVGFHERRSSYVADMSSCEVLPPHVSRLIPGLRALVESLSVRERLPQIEVAVGENAVALVFRHLLPLADEDAARLRRFAREQDIWVWLQPGGPESAHPFEPESDGMLRYTLAEFGVRIEFRPTDFTQVNHGVNRILVLRAVRLLAPRPGERIGDLYCGLGNFSLPIARSGAEVTGFEAGAELLERARHNAALNGLAVRFEAADLAARGIAGLGPFDKLLLDPPREGAIELVKTLPRDWPRRLVYVSCDPATLARDAGVLAHVHGFALRAAGVVNMFPHTAHVESIALFER